MFQSKLQHHLSFRLMAQGKVFLLDVAFVMVIDAIYCHIFSVNHILSETAKKVQVDCSRVMEVTNQGENRL